MFHKYFYSIIVLVMALAGCGGALDEDNSGTPATSSSGFKVAMILPGPIDDQAWSQSGHEGLQLIEKEIGAEVAYTADSSSMSEAEVEQIFRQYATEGYDFIIAHGGQYIPAAEMKWWRKNFPVPALPWWLVMGATIKTWAL
jgi:basic membrane protein A